MNERIEIRARDGIELTFFGEDLISAIDLTTGQHVEWAGTVEHDALVLAERVLTVGVTAPTGPYFDWRTLREQANEEDDA